MAAARTTRKRKAPVTEGYGVDVGPDPNAEPEPDLQIAGDPGQCGETACWSRTPITVTHTVAAREATFTSPWTGSIAYDFGDGTRKKGRGTTKHTYAAAGTFSVKAAPVASSCAAPILTPLAVTVA
jgi:hypothetical protein